MADFELSKWSDIVPVPQDDGPNPVVRINYTEDYTQLMNIFRGVVQKGELSERVLDLTAEILGINPGSYTVWQYRRSCLKFLNSDLSKELDYLDSYADENPKNYQIWQHRRAVVEALGDGSREKAFCEVIFEEDAKNYHAWAHRQWAIRRFALWDGELSFVTDCLEKDVRNNSAWNQRWFVVHERPEGATYAVLQDELVYVCASLGSVKKNESAWNYLRGLANYHPELVSGIIAWCENFISTPETSSNYLALGLLADLSEEVGTIDAIKRAIILFGELAKADAIRVKSWMRRLEHATFRLSTLST